ncbi:DUF6950 family protein [Eleftheria terrae]|uniref:DUF6950 family protein n=1 Tax=Eleftheria terrae TaxID=1597781 RepID=UPI00263B541E|nr:hypothetical protein [Eleftheria terrae]WKB52317.1 hypothetical protein N7L95_21375 [Eleftheria terrae]
MTTWTRLPAWRDRLAVLVAARLRQPFAWGQHDCALWVADAVHALTGQDPAAELRGRYHSALQAARLVAERGGLQALGTALFGPPIGPLLARVGDVGLVVDEGRELCAVCNGDHWLAPGAAGLVALELSAATVAWRIGT